MKLAARCYLVLGTFAFAGTVLLACSSSDGTPPPGGDDAGVIDSGALDAGGEAADADAGADTGADDDDFVVPDASVVCETSPCVTKISGASDGFCALLSDGRASCWGLNDSARLGQNPDTTPWFATPTIVEGLIGITHLEVSSENTCARVGDGRVYCWGSLDLVNAGLVPPDGGEPEFGSTPTPTLEDAVPAVQDISVGAGFACGTAEGGALMCWGTNEQRELGRGRTDSHAMEPPARATLVTQSVAGVIAGYQRTFVIAPDGNVVSWGANTRFGQWNFLLGRDSSEDPNERPTAVPLLSRVRGIATAFWHSCAVTGRFVTCWGANSNGQLGRGTFDDQAYLPARSVLAEVTDADDADAGAPKSSHDVPVQVVTSPLHSCAVLGSGRVYCWGNAGMGYLLGPTVKPNVIRGVPTRIDGFSGPVVGLAAGINATCALLRSGAVECWGANESGQLGTGTREASHSTPVRLVFPQ